MTNTANHRTRGQVVPYADPRAYTDRLNALLSPQGWTRNYETVTMNNITRTTRVFGEIQRYPELIRPYLHSFC